MELVNEQLHVALPRKFGLFRPARTENTVVEATVLGYDYALKDMNDTVDTVSFKYGDATLIEGSANEPDDRLLVSYEDILAFTVK